MDENKNLENANVDNNETPEGTKPAEEKKPNILKRIGSKAKGAVKVAAPVAAKMAVIGGAAGAAAVAVIHVVHGDTAELSSRLDDLKDAIIANGASAVDSVKDAAEELVD